MRNLLKFKTRVIICISILLISIASTVSAQDTIAIIDAGSSGSRLWVYEVVVNGNGNEIKIDTIRTAKGPALSTITPDSISIHGFLATMTSKYNVNKNGDTIPLYVLATAGMRMIPQVKADIIYQIMKRNSNLEVGSTTFQLKNAMTISGQYEGLYAWIAANYKAGNLKIDSGKLAIHPDSSSVGILEIGGASMQVAFAVEQNGDRKHYDNIIEDSILGKIYSKSYLHYGADRIFEQLRFSLPPDCLVPLDTINGLYGNSTEKFVGLSNPIKYRKQELTDADRIKDNYEKFHPAINNIYIGWVLKQLRLVDKFEIFDKVSDWTEGAALDILINEKMPQSFNYSNPN